MLNRIDRLTLDPLSEPAGRMNSNPMTRRTLMNCLVALTLIAVPVPTPLLAETPPAAEGARPGHLKGHLKA